MTDLSLLKAKIATDYAGQTHSQTLIGLNAKTIMIKKPIHTRDIKKYLMLVDLLIPIEQSTAQSCQVAKRSLELFDTFDIADPVVLTKLTTVLDDLVAEVLIPDFTVTHKMTILAMGDGMTSWADQNWFGDVTLTDIANAEVS
jgi:hypothetical protein